MIGQLRGKIIEQNEDGTCILDVQGVGYELFIPMGKLLSFTQDHELMTLFVHTHVREDALSLFGFMSREDRTAFRQLLTVSSIGPKSALAIMGVLDAQSLATAISIGDKNAFKAIPGVGKKTIERLLIDLKDKLKHLPQPLSSVKGTSTKPAAPKSEYAEPLSSVIHLLTQMGYKTFEAEKAVSKIDQTELEKPVEQLLKQALASMT